MCKEFTAECKIPTHVFEEGLCVFKYVFFSSESKSLKMQQEPFLFASILFIHLVWNLFNVIIFTGVNDTNGNVQVVQQKGNALFLTILDEMIADILLQV